MHASLLQKYKKHSTPALKRKAIRVFHAWIRKRDRRGNHFVCVSCGKRKLIVTRPQGGSNYHAGHYYPAGQYESLRLDEVNVNGECDQCNYFSGDHLIGYRETIIERHGQAELDRIDLLAKISKRSRHKWGRIELIEIIEKYK